MKKQTLRLFALLLFASGLLIGCASHRAATANPDEAQRFAMRGQIMSVDIKHQKATIAHENIPGYMEAMTMPFVIKDASVLPRLKQGDVVQATLIYDPRTNLTWLENVQIQSATTAPPTAAEQANPAH